jgi:hypothetical protein
MPNGTEDPGQFSEQRRLTPEVQCHVMRQALVDKPFESTANVAAIHLNQQAVAGNTAARRDRLSFEGGPVILAVASPDPRDGHIGTSPQRAVDDKRTRSIEMAAE